MSKMASIINIANAKGGVGKTTISTNISHILSYAGYKVLHVDLDPQGSGSELLRPLSANGQELRREQIVRLDIFNLLAYPVNTKDYIFSTRYENLDIIPNARSIKDTFTNGTFDSRFAAINDHNKFTAFLNNLEQVRCEYDYIIIDGQPGMNYVMKVGFIASDAVLTPAYPDIFNLRTIEETCKLIDMCNREYNLDIQYLGFFLNNVNKVSDKNYLETRQYYIDNSKEYFIPIPVRYSQSVNNSSNKLELWLEYAFERTVNLPNPVKDILNILYNDLMMIDEEHKENLIKAGVKSEVFEVEIKEDH